MSLQDEESQFWQQDDERDPDYILWGWGKNLVCAPALPLR